MQQRETFIAYGDLLRELAAQCRASEQYLRDLGCQDSDSIDQLADWVAIREERLAEGLERCAEEGPQNMVERMLQYKLEHRSWETPPDRSAALKQTIAVNQTVADVLEEETSKSAPPDIGERMRDLTKQVDAINRKVSLALVTSQDM